MQKAFEPSLCTNVCRAHASRIKDLHLAVYVPSCNYYAVFYELETKRKLVGKP